VSKKRGATDLCFVCAIDKPAGMTSHDVVSRVRRATGERRVGHAGTLDPMATGVLPVLVGPATRLDAFLSADRKVYEADIVFGAATATDDAEGEVIRVADVPEEAADPTFAITFLSQMQGWQKQIPPAYSAIKQGGRKACDEARKGRVLDLAPRDICVHSAELVGMEVAPHVVWRVRFDVSKGTYIRALARDIGRALDSAAHLGALRRVEFGLLGLGDCIALDAPASSDAHEGEGAGGSNDGLSACAGDALSRLEDSALDIVKLLGHRIVFVSDDLERRVRCGNALPAGDVQLFAYTTIGLMRTCACASGLMISTELPTEGELVSVVADNRLVAIYEYTSEVRVRPHMNAASNDSVGEFRAKCVFSIGVSRGKIV
jgi:tRNA pseudouridine55 synthase